MADVISLDTNEAAFSKTWPSGKHLIAVVTVCQLEETTLHGKKLNGAHKLY